MTTDPANPLQELRAPTALERTTLSKVTRRLIPFMFVLYIAAYLDRINVGSPPAR